MIIKKLLMLLMVVLLLVSKKKSIAFSDVVSDSPGRIKLYLSLSANRNYPVYLSKKTFSTSGYSPTIGLRVFHLDHWLLGTMVGYKKLYIKQKNTEVSLVTLTQETYYRFRLYHPIYAGIGFKLHYFRPVKSSKGRLSLAKHMDYNSEYGAALSAMIFYHLSKDWLATFYLDRWRGFGTNYFHGVEWGIGVAYRL